MGRMEENSCNKDAWNESQRGRSCSTGQDLRSPCSSSGVNASVWPIAAIMGAASLGCAWSNPASVVHQHSEVESWSSLWSRTCRFSVESLKRAS